MLYYIIMSDFSYRFRYYSIGLVIGIFFVFIFFSQRMRCSQFLPNGRVLAEIQTKNIIVKDSAIYTELKRGNKTYTAFLDSMLQFGDINFSESDPRKKPCGAYVLYYKNYKLQLTKCSKDVYLNKIEKTKVN